MIIWLYNYVGRDNLTSDAHSGCFYTSANVKSSVSNNTLDLFRYIQRKIYIFDLITLEPRILIYKY